MKKICVYCGSSPGIKPVYSKAARDLGHVLAEKNIGLVFGGGKVGLMGIIARAVLEKDGEVTGVIPKALADRKVGFMELQDIRVVDSMHERKALMAELSDGFIALPGGLGTIEEIVEALTWLQLGMHKKPCGLLNVDHYFDTFLNFLDHVTKQQFLDQPHRESVLVDTNPQSLLEKCQCYHPPTSDKARWALKKNSAD